MLEGRIDTLNEEALQEFAGNAEKIAGAIQQLQRMEGWHIFLAVLKKKKREIESKRDYPFTNEGLVEHGANLKALDIVDDIIGELEGYIEDAEAARKALVDMNGDNDEEDRGIMLIDNEVNKEG